MKKTRDNMSMYEISKLTQHKDLLMKALNEKNGKASTYVDMGNAIVSSGNVVSSSNNSSSLNIAIIGNKSCSMTPPFLMTF